MNVRSKLVSLICLIALVGCATYTPQVDRPNNDAGVEAWKSYYRDQFRAYGKDVQAPGGEASEAQRTAFVEEKQRYDRAVVRSWIISGTILAIGVSSLMFTIMQMNQLN